MSLDFNAPTSRIGTHSMKWDGLPIRFGVDPEGAIPMWVADMEFPPPEAVTRALEAELRMGVFGYYGDDRSYRAAIQGWMKRRHGWEIETDWIKTTPGIVAGVNLAIQAFCRPGDGVILQTPIYHPFPPAIRNNGCQMVGNLLRLGEAGYEIDFEALRRQVDSRTRMLILCSPHNPCGRVWTRAELTALAEFCLEREILIVSDEIHHDLVFEPGAHTVTATLGPDVAANTVTFAAPSKTFNLAGGHTGAAIISDPELRRLYARQLERCGLLTSNRFGMVMAEAAYAEGDEWLDALMAHLRENRDLVDRAVAERLPGVRSIPLEATYLSWLDFTGTGMDQREIVERFQNRARVVCNHGASFGPGGDGFMRLNFACPRPMLEEALERIVEAFSDLQ